MPSVFGKASRRRSDKHFTAPSEEEAANWANVFANHCHVNVIKVSPKERKGTPVKEKDAVDVRIVCKPGPVMLVVVNPRSGRGKASKVFRTKVKPVLEVRVSCCLFHDTFAEFVLIYCTYIFSHFLRPKSGIACWELEVFTGDARVMFRPFIAQLCAY